MRRRPPPAAGRQAAGQPRARVLWYGAMAAAGFGFGLFADRRPFGDQSFLHPVVLFFIAVALALLTLRVVLARPVPEVIPERALVRGCALGLAAFLAGNLVAARVLFE